ncbi:MAG: universal stress protein [Geminicoccaceae bacterium]
MLPQIKTILYATDLDAHAAKVFRYAVAMAQAYEAKIILLTVMEPLTDTGEALLRGAIPDEELERYRKEGLTRAEQDLHARIEAFCQAELGPDVHESDVIAETRVVRGHPAQVIVDQAKTTGVDVIVMGMHSHSRFEQLFIGSEAHKVVNHSKTPVLLVPLDA